MSKKHTIKKTFTLTFECSDPYELQGHLIKIARINGGFSQQGLAEKLGMSRRSVQLMEIHGADGVVLMKLIKLLGLNVDYFLLEE